MCIRGVQFTGFVARRHVATGGEEAVSDKFLRLERRRSEQGR